MSATDTTPLAQRPENVPPALVVDWNVYKPTEPHEDIFLAWKKLHDGPDIFWTPHYGGHWVVIRAEDIEFLQRNHDPFSAQQIGVPRGSSGVRNLPSESDPPEHKEYRAIVTPWFTPRNIDALALFTQELAARIVAELHARGECEFYAEFSLNLPIAIFCKMGNIPHTDQDMLLAWAEDITRGTLAQRFDAFHDLAGYAAKLLADRQANPGTDIISDVVKARIGEQPISHEAAISVLVNVMVGGLDTVASSMSFIAHFLATHPEHRRQIAENPEIIPRAVEEFLRSFTVSQTARTLTRDYDYKGIHFKKGDMVMVPHFFSGLDDRKFDNPLEVDFNRERTIHGGFGGGVHRCPGSYLARTEIRIFLEEWFKRIPDFGIKPGERVRFGPGAVNCVHYLPLSWQVVK